MVGRPDLRIELSPACRIHHYEPVIGLSRTGGDVPIKQEENRGYVQAGFAPAKIRTGKSVCHNQTNI
jgi:hypothetical protein